MSDSHDPFGPPPDDRFAPARPAPRDWRDQFLPVGADRPVERRLDEEAAAPPVAPMPHDGLGESLTPLEPLPAMAGNFGTPAAGPHAESTTLTGRLVDEFVAWLKTLASAAVYATLIVTFGFQVARVEGQSMAPTLQDQDRLIVNKFAYLSAVGEPEVGDIVMLYYPSNPEKSFVKRVIARENDRVRIVDGKVYRNDVLVDDSFVPDQYRSHEDWGPDVVPEGYYFVMGDHRNNSSDSRHWGFVPKKYIIGRVQLRWWPVPEARTF